MMRRQVLVGSIVAAIAIAACSGTGRDSSSSRAPGGAGASTAADAVDSAKEGAAAVAPVLAPTTGRDVVTNATIGLKAKRVDDVTSDATAFVTAAGGYLFSENAAVGSRSDAMMVFKVPPAAFDVVMEQVGGLGKRVNRQVTTDDVTAQVVDLEGRLASATGSMNRLRALYDRAENVGEIVAIEAELVKREAEVESLQGQLRVVESQVALATITLTVAKLVAGAPTTEEASGFLAGLDRGWDALTGAAATGATALGLLLPFLALAALGCAVTLGVRRRLRLRPTAPTA